MCCVGCRLCLILFLGKTSFWGPLLSAPSFPCNQEDLRCTVQAGSPVLSLPELTLRTLPCFMKLPLYQVGVTCLAAQSPTPATMTWEGCFTHSDPSLPFSPWWELLKEVALTEMKLSARPDKTHCKSHFQHVVSTSLSPLSHLCHLCQKRVRRLAAFSHTTAAQSSSLTFMCPECCHPQAPGCPSTQGYLSLTHGAATLPFMVGLLLLNEA